MNTKWFRAFTLIPYIIAAVSAVESLSKGASKEKQDAALAAFSAIIAAVEVGFDKEILNEVGFQILIRRIIDDIVAVQNFIHNYKK